MIITQQSVSAAAVLFQGVTSFFSPCVLPILPLFLGYLSGSADQDPFSNKKGRLILNTLFFVFGISSAFFLLALGVTSLGRVILENSGIISKAGGAIVILFGVYQLGIFKPSRLLSREARFHFFPQKAALSPLTAFFMGFTFSFGWTPCVGPALTSAILMASSSESAAAGFALIGLYTLGFTFPFILTAFFTEKLAGFFASKQRFMTYIQKAGAIIMITMGVLMFSGYFSAVPSSPQAGQTENEDETSKIKAPEITLADRNGELHSLSDYEGKTVFLNFWATWCGPCKSEMPDIQKLYEEYGSNENDLVILAIATPEIGKEGTQEEIEAFLDENGYTYPVLFDPENTSVYSYGVSSLPTTFMIDDEGYVFGYVAGAISYETMEDIVAQTMKKQYNR